MNSFFKKMNQYDKGVALNYLFKIIGMFFSFISVRLTITYLGNETYGLWVTILSVIAWMGAGDLGIGNGLRNQLAKAYGEGNAEKEKTLIVTSFFSLGKVAICLYFLIIFLTEMLIRMHFITMEVRLPMYVSGFFFCVNLYLGLSTSIVLARQKSWYVTACNTFNLLIMILVVISLQTFGIKPDLNIFAALHGFCSLLPNIVLIFILNDRGLMSRKYFKKENYRKELESEIKSVGLGFFCLQICSIILYSTDNLIIYNLFDAESVTKYSVITKIYDTGQNLFSVLLISLWSAVTFQYAQKNMSWIKNETKRLLILWSIYSMGVIIVSVMLNGIVSLWLGKGVYHYDSIIVILFCAYGITISNSAIFANLLNGFGRIKPQMILAIISAIINIPLSIYFGKQCGLGIIGVKLATFLSALMGAIVMPIQVRKIFKEDKTTETL